MSEDGIYILPRTRRPDGTIRKEVRVRAGYVPQDEQPVYVSRMVQARQSAPKCPGLAPEEDEIPQKQQGKSRSSAAKNARRRERRAEAAKAQAETVPSANEEEVTASRLARLNLEETQAEVPRPVEKELRALAKKVRQAEELAMAQSEGKLLLPEQERKLNQLPEWKKKIEELESGLVPASS